MKYSLIQAQTDTASAADTLTQSYSSNWEGSGAFEHASPAIQAAASNDLIFIVLGVSLIIWFVLLFFIIRVDRKVGQLEHELKQSKNTQQDEA